MGNRCMARGEGLFPLANGYGSIWLSSCHSHGLCLQDGDSRMVWRAMGYYQKSFHDELMANATEMTLSSAPIWVYVICLFPRVICLTLRVYVQFTVMYRITCLLIDRITMLLCQLDVIQCDISFSFQCNKICLLGFLGCVSEWPNLYGVGLTLRDDSGFSRCTFVNIFLSRFSKALSSEP